MDQLGVDVQVIYPTIFLRPLTNKPAVDRALCRSYNRWLADIWAEGKGRLRWAAVLPLLDMDAALAELRWAREHGACAVFIRGLEGDKRLVERPDEHFTTTDLREGALLLRKGKKEVRKITSADC